MATNETKTAPVVLDDLFVAYRSVDKTAESLRRAKAAVVRLKEEFKDAKEVAEAAKGNHDTAVALVFKLLGGLCPQEAAHTLGWIDATTRLGRRFKLADSEDRVEFRGIEEVDGVAIVRVFLLDGLLAGETFFPQGDMTVEMWNADFAAKVEGYTDVKEAEPGTGNTEDGGKAPALEWSEAAIEDEWMALSQITDDGVPFAYQINKKGKSWRLDKSDAELLDADGPLAGPYPSLEAAQAACQRIEDENVRRAGQEDGSQEPGARSREDSSPAPGSQSPAPSDATWRPVRLDNLGGGPSIPARTQAILAEHEPPIVTIGDLTDWEAKKGQFWAADIKGVGQAAVDKITAALDAFWMRQKKN
jgi:hypothetical protein